jgi:hypothetical protein
MLGVIACLYHYVCQVLLLTSELYVFFRSEQNIYVIKSTTKTRSKTPTL